MLKLFEHCFAFCRRLNVDIVGIEIKYNLNNVPRRICLNEIIA